MFRVPHRVPAAAMLLAALAASAFGHASPARAAESRQDGILRDARAAFTALEEEPNGGIPDKLLRECRCIAVFPGVVKGAIGWGGRFGRGTVTCRDTSGAWSPPVFMTLTGGSLGFQLGVQKADVTLFVMNEKSARRLFESEFTLGATGAVAVGPVGRGVEGSTDVRLDAEIYAYARAKGLFAGISIEGARLAVDAKGTRAYYGAGADVTPQAIAFGHAIRDIPPRARELLKVLP